MASFVSSILHNSANKIESMSKHNKSRLSMKASTANNYGYHHPKMSYSADCIPSPPPYDTYSPQPTPSTSWTSEMSAFAEKIRDDVASTFKSTQHVDRHSISQGMKLVTIAADEYEQGNESVALDIYLTGVDKIIMALPNKTDMNTKIAMRDKLSSIEGLFNLTQKKNDNNKIMSSYLLSRITSTMNAMTNKAYQNTTTNTIEIIEQQQSSIETVSNSIDDSMSRFKRWGQSMIDIAVACAIFIKQSPLPSLVSFLFGYLVQLFVWIDIQYHITQRVQDLSVECIKMGIQADEKYHLHEFITEGIYMIIVAGLKAAVAYKETPRYKDTSILNK